MMREAFHAQLDALAEHSGSRCMVTGALLEQATRSACQTDPAAAHWVIAGAVELDRQRGHAGVVGEPVVEPAEPIRVNTGRMVTGRTGSG
jgi:hypothetical protein